MNSVAFCARLEVQVAWGSQEGHAVMARQLRTAKSHFEGNTGKKLPVDPPLTGWLVLWAGKVMFKCVVNKTIGQDIV